LQGFRLCRLCSERQGSEALEFEAVTGRECFICAGMMDKASRMARAAAMVAKRYEFRTFSVGVSVPEGVQEREDELRSNLKLKGNETIKTQAARLVAGDVSKALGKGVDRQRPDLTLLVDFGLGKVSAASRPLFYYGRYTKPAGISQRRELCRECGGGGCKKCRNAGFERKLSVEGLLRRKIAGFSGSDKMTFSWLGSEDRESLVSSPGRPFVVDVKSPRKRRFPKAFGVRFRGGTVTVSSGRMLPAKPIRLPSFRFSTKIRGTAASKVSAEGLAELRTRFRRAEVRFERPHNRPTTKTVYRASATARGRTLFVDAELDGGLPVKRFVSGELVSPSVSEVLKTEVVCRSFDICGVKETGKFEFAEITRIQKKD
jgi:tRNA pseudouridine synthase 10